MLSLISLIAVVLPGSLPDDTPLWNTYDTAAWSALRADEYSRAEKIFREAIATNPTDRHKLGRSKTGLAWSLHRQGKHAESHRTAVEAEQLTKDSTTIAERVDRADCLHVLARTYCDSHDWNTAKQQLATARDILQRIENQDERIADMNCTEADLWMWQFRPIDAMVLYQKARQQTRELRKRHAITLNQVIASMMIGDLHSAENSLSIIEPNELTLENKSVFDLLQAELAYLKGEYLNARMILDTSVPCPDVAGGLLSCLNHRALLSAHIAVEAGDFMLAQRNLQELTSRLSWEAVLIEAQKHDVLGEIDLAKGRFEDARKHFQSALTCKQQVLTNSDPRLMESYFGRATASCFLSGLRHDVVESHAKIQEILVAMKATTHPILPAAMRLLAKYKIYHGDFEAARVICQDANKRVQGTLPLSHPERAAVLETLALAELSLYPNDVNGINDAARHIVQANEARIGSTNAGASSATSGSTSLLWGWILLAQKDSGAAFNLFQQANQQFESAEKTHSLRGDALLGICICQLPNQPQLERLQAKDLLRARLGPIAAAHELAGLGLVLNRTGNREMAIWITELAIEFYQEGGHLAGVKTMQENIQKFTEQALRD